MLGRWLKKKNKLNDPDPLKRAAAVAALGTETDDQDQLASVSQNDPDQAVREAAVAKLSQASTLELLLADSSLAEVVAKRMAQLIKPTSNWQWFCHEPVFSAFLRSMEPADADEVLPHITTADQLAEILITLPHGQAETLLTHPLLGNEAGLQILEKSARGRSKTLYRFAHERLNHARQQKATFAAIEARCEGIDESLSKPSEDFPRLRKLLAVRQDLVAQANELRVDSIYPEETFTLPPSPLVEATLVAREQELAQQQQVAAQEAEAVEAAAEALKAQPIEPAGAQPEPGTTVNNRPEVERLDTEFWKGYSCWDEQDSEALLAQQLTARQRRHQELSRHLQKLAWPDDAEMPEVVKNAVAEQSALSAAIDTLTSKIKQRQQQLDELLVNIEQALESGATKALGQQISRARETLKQLPRTGQSIEHAEKKITQLSARLAELRDWQKFATDPKRQALLAELTHISEHPLAPPEQAAKLKDLREQWQQMGRPTSAGGHQQQAQFDQLAEIAFEPCKAYYEELGREREQNLIERTRLTEQLAAYLEQTDWSQADYKAAEQIMRTARDEWRRFHPCERQALKPVETQFEALQTELHSRLKSHWDANIATKQNIIEQAKALIEAASDDQVTQVKQLQQRWKSVGATPRTMDQRLWREFRAACDAVFDQRKQQHNEQLKNRAELEDKLSKAIEQLEQAAQRAQENLDATAKEYDALNQPIEEIAAQLDRPSEAKRLQAARSEYRAALKRVANLATINEINELKAWDTTTSDREISGETVDGRSFADDLVAECLALTLEAELAADLPSPSADQNARMALQVAFMNQGIRDLSQRDHLELIARWNQLGPKNAALAPLRERFFAAVLHRFN